MDLKELRNSINLISKLKEGETIDSYNGDIQNKSYWSTTFYRTIYGDSRNRMCQYLKGIIDQIIAVIHSDKKLREEMLELIDPIIKGLLVLIATYNDELVTKFITNLISELNRTKAKFIPEEAKKIETVPDNLKLVSTELEQKLSNKIKKRMLI